MIFTLLQQLVIDLRNCIKSIKYFLYYPFIFLEHFQKSSKSESDLLVSLQFRNKSSVLPSSRSFVRGSVISRLFACVLACDSRTMG